MLRIGSKDRVGVCARCGYHGLIRRVERKALCIVCRGGDYGAILT